MRTVRGGGEPRKFEPPRTPNQAGITGALAEESLGKGPDARTALARLFACSALLFLLTTAGPASAIGPLDPLRFDAAAAGSGGIPFLNSAQGRSLHGRDRRLVAAFENLNVGQFGRAIETAQTLAEYGDLDGLFLLDIAFHGTAKIKAAQAYQRVGAQEKR